MEHISVIGYWINLSARSKIDCGILRPRAFSGFTLITNSKVLG